jgi:hypothetical protein
MRRLAAATALALTMCGVAQAETTESASAIVAAGTGAPVIVAPNSQAEDGAPDADKARLELYGQVMLDAIYDFKRMSPEWAATLRPSQIPIVCPGSPGCGKDQAFIFSVRQSSLGFRSFIPTNLGMVKTDLAFDLFGTDGGTNIHWLRAWAELGMWGVGQIDSNFMDIDVFPNTIDYWGPPGMVFVRNPQVRFTPFNKDGMAAAISLEAPNSVIDTGKVTDVDPALGAGVTGRNRLPDLVGSFRYDGEWGHVKVAGILRQVGWHNVNSPDGEPSGRKPGYGINVAGVVKVLGRDQVNWQLVTGTALASYMNDGGTDIAPCSNLRGATVNSLGWLLYYNHSWSEKWTSAIGYSEHTQHNLSGQLGTAFHRGSYGSTNVLYSLSKNVTTGVEYIWGKHESKDGASATDYRLQWSTRVTF